MDSEEVVCSLHARRINSMSVDVDRVGGLCREGAITIRKISDTNFLFQYESECRSNTLVAVLDNVVLTKDRKVFYVIVKEDLVTFMTDNIAKYQLFEEAVLECRMLSELVLRLGAVCRDIYYAGMYASSTANGNDLILNEDIQILRERQLLTPGFNIFELPRNDAKNIGVPNIVERDNHRNSISSCLIAPSADLLNISCVFCRVQKSTEKTLKFAVHPYVPVTFKKEEVYMCLPCMHNWKDYREKAILDDQLVLKGELNEELCGICSDTPYELTMCCQCPRSFCMTCLSRILTVQQKDDLDKPSDWICMCCTNKISQASPSLNSSQWSMIGPNQKKKGIIPTHDNKNKYEINDEDTFLTDEFMSLLSIPKNLLQKKKKNKNRKKKNLHSHGSVGIIEKDDVQISQNFMDVCERTKSDCDNTEKRILPKAAVSTAVRTASESKLKCMKIKSKNIQDVKMIFTSNDMVKKNNVGNNSSLIKSENAIQDKIFDDIHNGITPLRNCRLQKLDQNICTSNQKNDSTKLSIMINKNLVRAKKVHPSIIKEYSLTNIPQLEPETFLPPVSSSVDEVYYFSQYIHGASFDVSKKGEREEKNEKNLITDDVCFLCKDGGNLIECDHVYRGTKKRKRCQRVYHTYCLSFAVNENSKHWTCPQHFCDSCGSRKLAVVCKYCPMSMCAPCVEKSEKMNHGPYRVLPSTIRETSSFNDSVKTVVCTNCERMLERCRLRGNNNMCVEIKKTDVIVPNPSSSSTIISLSTEVLSSIYSPPSLLSPYTFPEEKEDTDEFSENFTCNLNSSPKRLSKKLSAISVVSSRESRNGDDYEDSMNNTENCITPIMKSLNSKKRSIDASYSPSSSRTKRN